ncbi:lysosomal alpha-mannosidase, putative [Ixodes scapularis]|uniref:Lysosomal alpha-mannosidase, putative n=1 Tax=Ixodes scapularis TaxID=6945 RepID=B7QEJ1_IXOSC|nr:lysosomal alpha-mannosidase, putative [Ixodes scapularis]|eukprot:XP_002413955.1 lysosomal alpha-mannosidase, putative [Ixodes scapularis]
MGLDGVFLGRIHVNDKQFRRSQKSLEFVWNADRNLGKSSELFASVLPNVYQPPKGFCFDRTSCAPGADVLAKDYGTKNVMVTMGGDLAYTKADSWFDNLDRLIAAVNKEAATTGTPVQAFYSTPSCYLRAVNNASAPWPVHTQDFLPYADKQHFYWTGLYSSRPSLKRYARYANGFLQKVISDGMVSSLWRNPESFDEPLQFCHRLNETVCFMTENVDRFVVVAYNPMSHKATHNIRLPVPFDDGYKVQSYDNKTIESQVVPRVNTVLELPSKTSTATNELVFQVEIPQLGASAFHVSRTPSILAFLPMCHISRARSLRMK